MIVPLAIGTGVAVLAWKARKKQGMTPIRKKTFEAAMKTQKEPDKLHKLAAAFHKEGLKAEAAELRKRAAIFSAPPETIEKRKQVFKQAMSSNNPDAVKKVASAFHRMGHYEAAQKLRNYAKGIFHVKGPSATASVKIGEDDASTPQV